MLALTKFKLYFAVTPKRAIKKAHITGNRRLIVCHPR
jgi:hypothetical protein